MLGDSNAGKTSLVLRFAEGYYREGARSSTVGAFFITKRIQTSNGITCKIQIWDTAGQKQFRAMAPMYYKNAAAAIVCYDVTNPESYTVMREWLDELHRNVPGTLQLVFYSASRSLKPYFNDFHLYLMFLTELRTLHSLLNIYFYSWVNCDCYCCN
jgi:small GTP-binding protein